MARERKGAGEEEVGFRKGFSQGAGGSKRTRSWGPFQETRAPGRDICKDKGSGISAQHTAAPERWQAPQAVRGANFLPFLFPAGDRNSPPPLSSTTE